MDLDPELAEKNSNRPHYPLPKKAEQGDVVFVILASAMIQNI